MSYNPQLFDELLGSYLSNEASANEWAALMEMIKSGEYDELLKQKIENVLAQRDEGVNISPDRAHNLLYKILTAERHTAKLIPIKSPLKKLWSAAAAACFIILLSVAGYFYLSHAPDKPITQTESQPIRFKNDVAPGGNKAILTLADGSQIILDSAHNGTIAQQGNSKIIKLDNGEVAYKSLQERHGEVFYNTITTPKGGQYQIVLADGSKVWLNAASSIRFPTVFAGIQREVELTGEGYFEVFNNPAKPFHLKINGVNVEVLGTHFNVNAYTDEAVIKTTLLEGSVKISKDKVTGLLKPGQQGQLNRDGQLRVVNVDVDEAVAWKNGFFRFSNASIESVMRQVEKWYDVEVQYEEKVSKIFKGEVPRSVNISMLLKILESTGWVRFKIDGKKIIVMP